MIPWQYEIKQALRRRDGAKMPFREALRVVGASLEEAPPVRRTLTIMGGKVSDEHGVRTLFGFELKAGVAK